MSTRVAISRCNTYQFDEVKKSISEVISNSDFPIVKNKKVLVKPNILSDSKVETGITTNPVIIEAFIELLKELGANDIYLGDSPGLHTASFDAHNCGLKDVCQRTNTHWVDFTKDPIDHKIGKYLLPMANIINEVDVVISVSKFKTHQLMYATGCVKNMFGTIPGINKSGCHVKVPSRNGFAELIAEIYRESKCCYGLMDGVMGMEGPGPANGNIRKVGLILGSSDSYLTDSAQATIMGYRIEDIPILMAGKRKGYTHLEPNYPLLSANELIIKDYKRVAIGKEKAVPALIKSTLMKPFHNLLIKKRKTPEFLADKCILCKRCVDICPAKALHIENNLIILEKNLCVRCYCCHEMCPKNAIEINE
ncbi:MAG: DUF362 domain-containing protein [Sphaerochaetaceae bacterium]|nr:DUF362 domain-containing protein [Sphaerochaetaceae bacterium]